MIGMMFSRHTRVLSRSIAITAVSGLGYNLKFQAQCSSTQSTAATNTSIPTIYQYAICPFCHRVKAYLDYLKVSYEVVEVNPLTKGELKFSENYKKVPIAVIDQQTIADSGKIIDYINLNLVPSTDKSFLTEDSEEWMEWSEKKLAIMLYPNITRSFEESWECFEYANKVESWPIYHRYLVRSVGPVGMLFANGKIKKKYGIVDERAELKKVLLTWTDALGEKKFLHGEHVTFPDVMVFGVLRAVKDFATFREIMQDNQKLKTWYDNVEKVITSHEICKV